MKNVTIEIFGIVMTVEVAMGHVHKVVGAIETNEAEFVRWLNDLLGVGWVCRDIDEAVHEVTK